MSFSLRRAMRLPQIRSQSSSITQRRGLADAAGKDGAAEDNFWQHPVRVFGVLYGMSMPFWGLGTDQRMQNRALEKPRSENKEDLSDKRSSV